MNKVSAVFACIDKIEGSKENTFVCPFSADHANQLVPDRFGVLRGWILQDVVDELYSTLVKS